jgi:flagellum-specific peptidoglycan hydrolase FlgJ
MGILLLFLCIVLIGRAKMKSIERFRNWTEFEKTELFQRLAETEKQFGYMRGVLACQAFLENRGGRCEDYNFANVKATPAWLKAGKPYHLKGSAKYRSYSSFKEAIEDYVAIVKRYYSYAWTHRHHYYSYYKGLMGKTNGVGLNDWAEDKNYHLKLIALYRQYYGQ